jgi:hypothetical protein
VTAGVGEPDVASWALVNSNKSLVNSLATQVARRVEDHAERVGHRVEAGHVGSSGDSLGPDAHYQCRRLRGPVTTAHRRPSGIGLDADADTHRASGPTPFGTVGEPGSRSPS